MSGSAAGAGPGVPTPSATRWARLTWQAGDPAALAAMLSHRLGLPAGAVGGGGWRLDLGGEPLEVVPWRRESPRDEPSPAGRLVFEPLAGGGPVPLAVRGAPLTLVGVVWSTVELDRAEAELDPWLSAADPAHGDGDAPADQHLGAHARRRRSTALPGGALVLEEPSTEGRLAASLARDGEGPCALLLAPADGLAAWTADARRRGVAVSARRPGPLGPAVLLPGQILAGPHLVIVEAVATALRASTIDP